MRVLRFVYASIIANAVLVWLAFTGLLRHKGSVGLLVVLVILGIEISKRTIHIDVSGIPKEMAERGYSPDATARMLRDSMHRIVARAGSPQANLTLKAELADVTVPQTGITLQSLVRVLRVLLPIGETTVISGDFVQDGKSLRLLLRVNGQFVGELPERNYQESTQASFNAEDPRTWDDAAKKILRHTQPHVVAWALLDEDPKKAESIARTLVASMPPGHPSSAWARMLLANRSQSKENYAEAREHLSKALDHAPNDRILRSYLHTYMAGSWIYDWNGDEPAIRFAEASKHFDLVHHYNADEPSLYYHRAMFLRRKAIIEASNDEEVLNRNLQPATEEFNKAITEFQRYIALYPTDVSARVLFANVLWDRGESPEAAFGELKKAIDLESTNPAAHITLCEFEVTSRLHDEVPASCTRAKELADRNPVVHHWISWHHYLRGNDEGAVDENDKAIQIDHERPGNYSLRSLIFATFSKQESESLRRIGSRISGVNATKGNAGGSPIDDALDKMSKARSLTQEIKTDGTITPAAIAKLIEESKIDLDKARRQQPTDSFVFLTYADLLTMAGDFIAATGQPVLGANDQTSLTAQATTMYRFALAANPLDVGATLGLANLLKGSHQYDMAQGLVRSMIDKFPGLRELHELHVTLLQSSIKDPVDTRNDIVLEYRRWIAASKRPASADYRKLAVSLYDSDLNYDAIGTLYLALGAAGIDTKSAAGHYLIGNFLGSTLMKPDFAIGSYIQAIIRDRDNKKGEKFDLLSISRDPTMLDRLNEDGFDWPASHDTAILEQAACFIKADLIQAKEKPGDWDRIRRRVIELEPKLKDKLTCDAKAR